jgi:hypothetical protein
MKNRRLKDKGIGLLEVQTQFVLVLQEEREVCWVPVNPTAGDIAPPSYISNLR